ncbi:glycosyltransferase family A protein [Sporichthya sp.]|uniref:glycosyltransferase family 2 protein n=1 Tax=Sporichthya sp. TaxID=65475 RepID=UPI0017D91811|nr:glycosyltransferase family A protein [Sporichthya sp.]MBA3742430.1 glycosyltransferase family 2 protein [Sporichthya sp.]
MSDEHVVTVGVPVYHGEQFLAETLDSIQAQTYRELRVLISIDGPDPVCEKIARPFLADDRFGLTVRQKRSGWVGNINGLMRNTGSAFWCYQQQDDLIAPEYLERLVDHLLVTPQAAVAYCDLQAFGQADWSMTQDSLTGHPVTRQLTLLHEHLPAIAFRGVTRTGALREMGRLPANPVGSFAVDTVWMAAMARSGELHRVPGYRYRKRYHDDNTHTKWPNWPAPRRQRAWATHCADMLQEALRTPYLTVQQRRLLWAAAVSRLTDPRLAGAYVVPAETGPAERARLLEVFTARIRAHRPAVEAELDLSTPELTGWTADFHRAEGAARPARLRHELAAVAPPIVLKGSRAVRKRLATARTRRGSD